MLAQAIRKNSDICERIKMGMTVLLLSVVF